MQRIGKNIFSLGASRVITGLLSFVAFIFLTQYLGTEGAGEYALVLAYYTIFSLLADLGVTRYVIKKISEDKSAVPLLVGNFFIVQFFLSLVVVGVFFALPRLLHFDEAITHAMWVAGLGLFAGSLAAPLSAVVQAYERIHVVAGVNFINTLINASWMAAAIIFRLDIVFLFAVFIAVGLLDIAIYYRYSRRLTGVRFVPDAGLMRSMIRLGIPFAFISGFEMVIAKIDVVIQIFFVPFHDIGLYATAYKLIDALNFVPAVVAISLFPYFARMQDMADAEIRHTVEELNRYLVALAIPMGVGGTILAEKIILTIFGEPFTGAVLSFQILIWATALTYIYAVPNIIMIAKRVRQSIGILATLTVFNAALNVIFVPRYGIVASAVLTVATYFLYAVAYSVYTRRLLAFSLLRFFPVPLAASAVMGAVLYLLRDLHVVLLIAAGAAAYLPLLVAVRYLRREDLDFLKSIFKKETSGTPQL